MRACACMRPELHVHPSQRRCSSAAARMHRAQAGALGGRRDAATRTSHVDGRARRRSSSSSTCGSPHHADGCAGRTPTAGPGGGTRCKAMHDAMRCDVREACPPHARHGCMQRGCVTGNMCPPRERACMHLPGGGGCTCSMAVSMAIHLFAHAHPATHTHTNTHERARAHTFVKRTQHART